MTMKKINIIKILCLFTLLSNCGFERMSVLNDNNFEIQKMTLSGNKKIGYNIKNSIMIYSNPKSENKIIINLNVKKEKISKEKNIANKVIKFTLNLSANLEIKELNQINKKIKNFNSSVDFEVGQNHSNTIIKESKSIESASNIIVDQMVRYLQVKYK